MCSHSAWGVSHITNSLKFWKTRKCYRLMLQFFSVVHKHFLTLSNTSQFSCKMKLKMQDNVVSSQKATQTIIDIYRSHLKTHEFNLKHYDEGKSLLHSWFLFFFPPTKTMQTIYIHGGLHIKQKKKIYSSVKKQKTSLIVSSVLVWPQHLIHT